MSLILSCLSWGQDLELRIRGARARCKVLDTHDLLNDLDTGSELELELNL